MLRHGSASTLRLYRECVGVLNISQLCHFERTEGEILGWNNSRAEYFTDLIFKSYITMALQSLTDFVVIVSLSQR